MKALAWLDMRIGAANAAEEAPLIAAALDFLSGNARARQLCEQRAFCDAAVTLHGIALPENLYQLGETVSRRGLAASWRPGDAEMRSCEAATPALALLRATMRALLERQEATRRALCARCRGRGWTVTRDGGKRVCNHVRASTIAAGP